MKDTDKAEINLLSPKISKSPFKHDDNNPIKYVYKIIRILKVIII